MSDETTEAPAEQPQGPTGPRFTPRWEYAVMQVPKVSNVPNATMQLQVQGWEIDNVIFGMNDSEVQPMPVYVIIIKRPFVMPQQQQAPAAGKVIL